MRDRGCPLLRRKAGHRRLKARKRQSAGRGHRQEKEEQKGNDDEEEQEEEGLERRPHTLPG